MVKENRPKDWCIDDAMQEAREYVSMISRDGDLIDANTFEAKQLRVDLPMLGARNRSAVYEPVEVDGIKLWSFVSAYISPAHLR